MRLEKARKQDPCRYDSLFFSFFRRREQRQSKEYLHRYLVAGKLIKYSIYRFLMKYIFITVVTETGGRCLIYFERKMDSYFFISHL